MDNFPTPDATGAAGLGLDTARTRHPAPFGLISVRGPDALDFVQRLCSQDVVAMRPGETGLGAFLNAKGKLITTAVLGRGEDQVWVETQEDQRDPLAELLERYHFTERVEIEVLWPGRCVEVVGPGAFAALRPAAAAAGVDATADGVVIAHQRAGLQWGRAHGVAPELDLPPLDDATAELLRIAARIPRIGVDTEASTLALEAGLDDHVSTTKGCYTGQEIVARIHTYGHVNRQLCLLEIDGEEEVARATPLLEPDEGDPVGRVMSAAPVAGEQRSLALGYLPGELAQAGQRVWLVSLDGRAARVR